MAKENLYDVWARRNPQFETHFEEPLLRQFTEYGGGSVESMSSKGKYLGQVMNFIFMLFSLAYILERTEKDH